VLDGGGKSDSGGEGGDVLDGGGKSDGGGGGGDVLDGGGMVDGGSTLVGGGGFCCTSTRAGGVLRSAGTDVNAEACLATAHTSRYRI